MLEVFEFGYLIIGYIEDAEVFLFVISQEKQKRREYGDKRCVLDPRFQ